MTCIVGIIDKKNGRVVIGGDSAACDDHSVVIRKDPKVFVKGEFIFGCCGSYRMIQLLQHSLVLPKIKGKIDVYMKTAFISSVKDCFKEGGFEIDSESAFIVGYKQYIFEIESDFQVARHISGEYVLGQGADVAQGSLTTSKKFNLTPEQRILYALQAAEQYNMCVKKPFKIKST